jgi:hypothetical protein
MTFGGQREGALLKILLDQAEVYTARANSD